MTEGSLNSPRPRVALVASGVLASGVAAELVHPLRELRDGLAELVGRLDQFSIDATGPHPYPYEDTKLLREELAGAYLTCRRATKLADDLAAAVDHRAAAAELVDANRLLEAALNLAQHRVASETEIFVDTGVLPMVRVVPAELVLTLAQLLIVCADSTRGAPGAAVSVKTSKETTKNGEEVVVALADNGVGCPEELVIASTLARTWAGQVGGSFFGKSEPGAGSAFELRIPVAR